MVSCAKRSLFAVAAMLAGNEVCVAFVQPAGLTSLGGRTIAAPTTCTTLERNSRRWDKAQQVDAGNGEGVNAGEKVRFGVPLDVGE